MVRQPTFDSLINTEWKGNGSPAIESSPPTPGGRTSYIRLRQRDTFQNEKIAGTWAGRIIRVTAEGWAASSSYNLVVGARLLRADGTPNYAGSILQTAGGGWISKTFDITLPADANYVSLQPWIQIANDTGSGTLDCVVSYIRIEDVTNQLAAAGSASLAATSASTASTKADAASGSASTAQTSASNASSFRDQANTSASNAATSANTASASAATATSQAIISTSYSAASTNLNDKFANWTDPNGLPNSWTPWLSEGNYRIERQGGIGSAYCVRTLNDVANVNAGFVQSVPIWNGKWVMEVTAFLDGGNWVGAGITLAGRWNISFNNDPDTNGVTTGDGVGQIRSWSKIFTINGEVSGSTNFHGMSTWDGFGTGRDPKYLRWYRLSLRPANAAEIAGNKALIDSAANSASIGTLQSTTASQGSSIAGLTTTVAARAVGGGNLISNTTITTLDGWFVSDAIGAGVIPSINAAGDAWHPYNESALSFYQGGRKGSDYVEWRSLSFGVASNSFIQYYAYCASHRSNTEVFLYWYNANGDNIGFISGGGSNYTGDNGGRDLSNFRQQGQYAVQVPSNAVAATLQLRKYDTLAGQGDSYAWFVRPYVGQARQGQSEWNAYAPGSGSALQTALNASVQTNASAIAAVDGRTQAYWQTVVNAGANATAFIQAKAKSADGVSDSTVAMGAKEIHLYNQVDGGFKKALSIVGGNAEFSGGLSAGAYIRLGSGVAWNVALRQQDFAVYDGQVVNFGTNLGNLPQLSFAGNNLVALSSGQTYSLYAENLTPTGFTARLRIITPAAPANYSLGPGSNTGSGPTYQIDKGANPDSQNGTYNLQFNCNITMAPSGVEDYQ